MHIALYRNRHTVEGRKDQLVRDLKHVVVDADELLNELANSTAEEFAATADDILWRRTKLGLHAPEARAALDDWLKRRVKAA